ncbi:MAG: hypothetical protein AVDCRST_MAG88-2744, partial [uncultured Thermomicrobiales bacterium]
LNPRTAAAMLDIARGHLRDGRQLLVFNTHADWDHCWGNQLFVGPGAPAPAPIVASRLCAERFRAPEAGAYLRSMQEQEPARFGEVRLVAPTVLFDERLTIDGGDLTLELFATPGHTPDHVAVWLPEIRTLLAGDAAELPFPFARSPGSIPTLRRTLARMVELEAATALYCHAPIDRGPGLLRENIAYFDALERQCREALAGGVAARPGDDEDVEALVAFPFAAALPPGTDGAALPDFYWQGHRGQIRMMLAYLGGEERAAGKVGAAGD